MNIKNAQHEGAFAVMTLDMVQAVLQQADDLSAVASYLLRRVRELSGAHTVIMIQCLQRAGEGHAHRLLGVHPERRRSQAESAQVERLGEIAHDLPGVMVWCSGQEGGEAGLILEDLGYGLSLALPLDVGAARMGVLLVLGLMDERHVASIVRMQVTLSSIVALVLRNAFLIEEQQSIIAERERAEEELRRHRERLEELMAERTAGLRKANEELRREIAERKQAENALRESEERYRSLVEHTSDAVFCYEYDPPIPTGLPEEEQVRRIYSGRLVECNAMAARFYGSERVEDVLGKRLAELFGAAPGGPVDELFMAFIRGGYRIVEGEGVEELPDGSKRYFSNNAHGVIVGDGLVRVWGAYRDITDRKRVEQALRRRDAVLEAVSFAAERFLRLASWEGSIQEVLGRLGQAAAASRVYVFENHTSADGVLLTSQRYEWTAPGITPQGDNPDVQDFPWQAGGMGRWAEILAGGDVVHGHVREFPESEQEILTAQGIQSITAVPVFVKQEWWGFIGFDECRAERAWHDVEIDALRAAAGILAAAIQRARMEWALRQREQEFKTLVENNPDMVARFDRAFRHIYVNPAVERELGLPPQALLGKTRRQLGMPAESADWSEAIIRRVFESGQEQVFETTIPTSEGIKHYLSRGVPEFAEDGSVASALFIHRNVTERVRAEEERERLLEAERQQHELAETLREVAGVVNTSLDREQVLALILEQLARVVEYENASVMLVSDSMLQVVAQRGLDAQESLLPALRLGDLLHVQEVLESQQPGIIRDVTADARWLDQPATRHVRCWLGIPLVVKDQAIGLLNLGHSRPGFYTQRDARIAQTFAHQSAIAIANAQLFTQVQTAYEELKRTQAQLIQSAKMAAVGTLAAGVAHELNNPLTSVLGFAQLLMRDVAPDDPIQEDLDTIVSEAYRARGIVRGLLAFARQTEVSFRPADANRVMQETVDLVRQQMEKSGIVIEEQYAADLPPLSLDTGRMKQVFLNLLTNAFHAMTQPSPGEKLQGGRLIIRSERVGDEVAVHVADTGVGIPAEHRPRLFEPFFTTKPTDQGTGLGLAVSLGIVQDHGGRIEVESREGEGSTFTVWLPLPGDDTAP